MYKKIREFTDHHINRIAGLLIIVVFILWSASRFSTYLRQWMREQDLLSVIMVVLLIDAIVRLADMKYGESRHQFKIFRTQSDANPELINFVKENESKEVDLLQYSSATIVDFLETLKDNKCEIRLLLKHPRKGQGDAHENMRCITY
jgi:hypothetical protein